MYADDVFCYLSNPVGSINALIERFELISGFKINKEKSVFSGVIVTERMKRDISKIILNKCQDKGVRYLGTQICKIMEEMVAKNIVQLINKIQDRCKCWSLYPLSRIGEIMRWNQDLRKGIRQEEWHKSHKYTRAISFNVAIQEKFYKLRHRWYLTPYYIC